MAHCIGLLLPGYHGSFVKGQKHLSLDIPNISGNKNEIHHNLSVYSVYLSVCLSVYLRFLYHRYMTPAWRYDLPQERSCGSSWDKPPQLCRTVQTRLGAPTCPP